METITFKLLVRSLSELSCRRRGDKKWSSQKKAKKEQKLLGSHYLDSQDHCLRRDLATPRWWNKQEPEGVFIDWWVKWESTMLRRAMTYDRPARKTSTCITSNSDCHRIPPPNPYVYKIFGEREYIQCSILIWWQYVTDQCYWSGSGKMYPSPKGPNFCVAFRGMYC